MPTVYEEVLDHLLSLF